MSKKSDAAKQAKIDQLAAAIVNLQAHQASLASLDISKLATAGTQQWAGTQHDWFIKELETVQKEISQINVGIDCAIADYQSKIASLNADLYSEAYDTIAKYEINRQY